MLLRLCACVTDVEYNQLHKIGQYLWLCSALCLLQLSCSLIACLCLYMLCAISATVSSHVEQKNQFAAHKQCARPPCNFRHIPFCSRHHPSALFNILSRTQRTQLIAEAKCLDRHLCNFQWLLKGHATPRVMVSAGYHLHASELKLREAVPSNSRENA